MALDIRLESGSQSFKPGRHEGGGMRFHRFRGWFRGMLDDIRAAHPGDTLHVAYEEVRRHAGTDAAHIYGGFLAHLAEICEELRVPYAGVPVAHVKREATGKGTAKKEAMIAAAEALGYKPADDNEADAIFIARHWINSRSF